MLDPKIKEALDNLRTVDLTKLQTVKLSPSGYSSDVGITDMGYNGLSTDDLPTLTTASITALSPNVITGLSTVQLSAIGGTTGYNLSATGGNVNWQSPYYINSAVGATIGGKGGQLQLKGEDADIVVNGKSMMQLLERIEDRLNLLEPNLELEKEWDDLRKLGERYRKLEKKCKEKAAVWKKLKDLPPPAIN
jgi:hypothetical protein